MKNGGLMKDNRQNEPNKLPIFGAYQTRMPKIKEKVTLGGHV